MKPQLPQQPALSLKNEDIGYLDFVALKKVVLSIHHGEKVALIGRSGAGKSTLLRRLYQLRPDSCAFIHQHYALVPQLSTFHNIYMGRLDSFSVLHNLRNLLKPSPDRLEEILPIAARLGLEDKLSSKIAELSGGQQQRVGIGRALYRGKAMHNAILMADEPVSSLDMVQQEGIMELITDTDKTVVSSLHSVGLSQRFFKRLIGLKDRAILFDLPAAEVSDSMLRELYQ